MERTGAIREKHRCGGVDKVPVKDPRGSSHYGQRTFVPELVFGIIKSVIGFAQFFLRGEVVVNGE